MQLLQGCSLHSGAAAVCGCVSLPDSHLDARAALMEHCGGTALRILVYSSVYLLDISTPGCVTPCVTLMSALSNNKPRCALAYLKRGRGSMSEFFHPISSDSWELVKYHVLQVWWSIIKMFACPKRSTKAFSSQLIPSPSTLVPGLPTWPSENFSHFCLESAVQCSLLF